MPSYWLLKTEPGTYSFAQLLKDGKTHWDGVRNYQARNFLRTIAKNDLALIYHSGDEKSVIGIAKVSREAYPDVDEDGGDWVQVDLKPIEALKTPVSLTQIKGQPILKEMPLIKHTRLSVMPITENHFNTILKMGGVK